MAWLRFVSRIFNTYALRSDHFLLLRKKKKKKRRLGVSPLYYTTRMYALAHNANEKCETIRQNRSQDRSSRHRHVILLLSKFIHTKCWLWFWPWMLSVTTKTFTRLNFSLDEIIIEQRIIFNICQRIFYSRE